MRRIARMAGLPTRYCMALVASVVFSSVGLSQEAERMHTGASAEKKYIVKLEATQHKQYCQARASIEYIQNDHVASVKGQIAKEGCVQAGGQYTVAVRIRDENGDLRNLEFQEPWSSDSELPLIFQADYEIGDDVDLIRVRTKSLKCVCVDSDDTGEIEIRERHQ